MNKEQKKVLYWGLGVLVVVLAVMGLAEMSSNKSKNTTSGSSINFEITEDDWVLGPRNASTTLVEYMDLQCPACASFHPIVKALNEEFPNELRIVVRHFPLVQVHGNAMAAARAAEAAGIQGKFWEMQDKLFNNQREWSSSGNPFNEFKSYAQELNLDLDKFEQDFNSETVQQKVEEDLSSARTFNLRSTPSIFLEGSQIRNPGSFENLKSMIEKEINS